MTTTAPESNTTDARSKTIPIIVLAVLLVLAAAVGLYYGLRPAPPEAPPVAAAPPSSTPAAKPTLDLSLSAARVDVHIGQSVTVTATVSGRGGDTLSFAGEGVPDGAVVESTGSDAGRLTWTPKTGQEGDYRVAIVAAAGERTVRREVTIVVAPPVMETVTRTMDEAAHFAFDRSNVSAADRDRLRTMVDGWREYAAVSSVTLTGHTDHAGAESYNQALGLRRAQAVQAVLVDLGVAADRIATVSNGETTPIAPNTTREGRARNRRCAVSVEARLAVTH